MSPCSEERQQLLGSDRRTCDPSRDSCTDQTPCPSCPKEETP